jgi:hypothetical protein
VRFLPEYDTVVLGFADRGRIISPEHQALLAGGNGYAPAFLLDGRVRGRWTLGPAGAAPGITVTPFTPLDDAEQQAVREEAGRLLRFHRPELTGLSVTVRMRADTSG